MHWEDESETWEPLNVIWRSDPVTLAKYADEKNLLDVAGWKRFQRYVKNKKKLNRMVKQVQLYTLRTATRIKFKIPRDHAEAMAFDKANGNSLWADAEKLELDQLYEYKSFRIRGRNGSMRKGYTKIRVRMFYDTKQCGKCKPCLVAGGHLTGPNEDTYYSSVVSLKAMRIALFLAGLNSMDTCAGDIGNAYLEAYTQEKVCFIAGPEFAAYGHAGHLCQGFIWIKVKWISVS